MVSGLWISAFVMRLDLGMPPLGETGGSGSMAWNVFQCFDADNCMDQTAVSTLQRCVGKN